MKKKPVVWLARDTALSCCYVVAVGRKPHWNKNAWGLPYQAEININAEQFERIAPKSVHLKPGEGPIEINVKITRVKS